MMIADNRTAITVGLFHDIVTADFSQQRTTEKVANTTMFTRNGRVRWRRVPPWFTGLQPR